jgi:hypothetical protein
VSDAEGAAPVLGAVPVAGAAPAVARDSDEDERLARLHLGLGMMAMARAELEDLERRGDLDATGRASLAQARWRAGSLEDAGTMAVRHLEAGGTETVAIVIAAEATAGSGNPIDARQLVEQATRTDVSAIDAIFAGMPRHAAWPAAVAPDAGPAAAARPESPTTASSAAASGVPVRASAVPTPADVLRANAGLWEDAGTLPSAAQRAPGAGPAAPGWVEPARAKGHADPAQELEASSQELLEAPERGLLRLALVLRLDPTLAPDVFEAVRMRREPFAAIVRGDAERLMGRHLEAEADFGEAMESIEREALAAGRPSQPGPQEDS